MQIGIPLFFVTALLCHLLIAQENITHVEELVSATDAPLVAQTQILHRIPDGTAPAPSPPRVLPAFHIKNTLVRRVNVVEPPPMFGLPPVKGKIKVSVNMVEDPGLPDPVIPAPRVLDPAQMALMKERAAKYVRPIHVSLSVTVYDHKRTQLKWSFYGNSKTEMNVRKQYIAWSNVDFSYFQCFSTYQVAQSDGRVKKYELMMHTMNFDSKRERLLYERFGRPYKAQEIPELPDLNAGGPAFMVMGGDASDPKALEFLNDLHELYQVEGERLEAAYHARCLAEEQRRAYLLEHPPVPQDVNVFFWKREHPIRPAKGAELQGGDP